MLPLVDIHCHLQDSRLSQSLPLVLDQAYAAGVLCAVCNGTREGDWASVHQLAASSNATTTGKTKIIPCFGLHPWHVKERSDKWLQHLEELLASTPSGVGEIGLDRWIEPRDEAVQETVFRAQLRLAKKLKRPIMIHCVRAWDWILPILAEEGPFPQGFLVHAFGGPEHSINTFVKLGGYFSCAGSVLHERKMKQRQLLLRIPIERLLLETDSPDLAMPESIIGQSILRHQSRILSEPAHLSVILQMMAQWWGENLNRFADIVWLNSQRFLSPIDTLPSLQDRSHSII